jgi:hypothetical protein
MNHITLRDYFIAHAPTEPQPWFKPVVPPYPGAGVWVSADGLRKYTDMFVAERAEGDAFTLFNQAEVDNWKAALAKQRYIQWPAAWADEMIQQQGQP